jgi:hypothetical protein
VTLAVVFTGCAAVLCAAAILALLGVAQVKLAGPDSIARDGLAVGTSAPRWTLTDQDGNVHSSPPTRPLQLVVFGDHSLKSFPAVIEGLRQLVASDDAVEVVLLLRGPNAIARPLLTELGLGSVAVLSGSPALYARYNVRVGPFLIFVDSVGVVRSSSLVNYAWQVAKMAQLARLPAEVA